LNTKIEAFLDSVCSEKNNVQLNVGGFTKIPSTWSFENRVLADHVFYYLTEGGIKAEIDGQQYRLKQGSCFWMKPWSQHTFECDLNYVKTKVYHFRFQVLNTKDIKGEAMVFHKANELFTTFKDAYDCLSHNSTQSFRIKNVFLNCMMAMSDHYQFFENETNRSKLNPVVFRKIREAFDSNPSKNWSVRELSKIAELSLDYFTVLFKGTVGLPPKSWLLQQKVKKASVLLLESSDNISECADQLGFSDIYHFSRCFKAHYGVSPKTWRNHRG
jgi:AraC-like DNA-binding protein